MTGLLLVSALLLQPQSPGAEPKLRDPFAERAVSPDSTAGADPLAVPGGPALVDPFSDQPRVQRPSGPRAAPAPLVDPFTTRVTAPRGTTVSLVDPFTTRTTTPQPTTATTASPAIVDPFSARPATLPSTARLRDPFGR